MSRAHPVVWGVWAAAISLAGCAASAFDRHFEAGQYELAARAHEADPAADDGARRLYRLGLTYALPRTAVSNPTKARAFFDQLRRRFPRSDYRPQADALLLILDDVIRVEAEASDHRRRLDSVKTAVAALVAANEGLRSRITAQDDDLARLRADVRRLEADVEQRTLAVRRLETELERLKSIDLGRPPR